MVDHFIIMASSYCKGTRIAFQQVYSGGVDRNEIQEIWDVMEQAGDGKIFLFDALYLYGVC